MVQSFKERDKGVKILARSLFKELTDKGYETRQIVALSSELLGLVTSSFSDVDAPEGRPERSAAR